jgi:hypothetical protein
LAELAQLGVERPLRIGLGGLVALGVAVLADDLGGQPLGGA